MVKIQQIMKLENVLLEAYDRVKFDLEFDDFLKLKSYIMEIGDITDFVFKSQELYMKERKDDIEGLKKYHNKVIESSIDYDISVMEEYIKKISDYLNDSDFKEIVRNYF